MGPNKAIQKLLEYIPSFKKPFLFLRDFKKIFKGI
jgi:hypothetical protein